MIPNYNLHSKRSWVTFISILLVFIVVIFWIITYRKFPKFKKNEFGILFSIPTENTNEYQLIKKKFVDEFARSVKPLDPNYKVVMLNPYTSAKFNNCASDIKILNKILIKSRTRFVIFGSSVFGSEHENLACTLHLDSGITHPKLFENNKNILIYEMKNAFVPLKNIMIQKKTETLDFENQALQLNFAFRYILATTQLLSSDIFGAINTFSKIKNDILSINSEKPVIKFIKFVIDERVCKCYNIAALIELVRYYDDEDTHRLENVKEYLDKADAVEITYESRLRRAIYHFLYNRDIISALGCLNECKDINRPEWRFSTAFLKLYSKDTISNFLYAYRVYNKSLFKKKVNYNFIYEIEEFIFNVLQKEPDKKQLWFLMVLIYYYFGNEDLIKEYYDNFISAYPQIIESDGMADVLKKLGFIENTSSQIYSKGIEQNH